MPVGLLEHSLWLLVGSKGVCATQLSILERSPLKMLTPDCAKQLSRQG
ncbi:hypothetical protein [Atopobium sp. oral taxon 416]|nr:hypothetical protein [Atopobium sp. oral taxon 416]QUC03406.1 hypothetical protein J4859_00015 [Atopobium sp. oral taxon 416]